MKCLYCAHRATEVTNSRPAHNNTAVWRRRQCKKCEQLFTTTENTFSDNLFVIKADKRRQRFVYEKLFASLFSVFNSQKLRDSGKNALLAKKVTRLIIERILTLSDDSKNIPTSVIISVVYDELKKLDLAYADHYIYYSPFRRGVVAKS